MKTIRLLYPDHVSGGLDAYFFGANLLAHILPENKNQPLIKVPISPPKGSEHTVTDGIYARKLVMDGIKSAQELIEKENPDKIITIGGNCIVSQAPFDYLHGKYENAGIIWIDSHPDVSLPEDGYPNAHAMVLASLLGKGDKELKGALKNKPFNADEILYIGLQDLHNYQTEFLNGMDIDYKIQTDEFVRNEEIQSFASRFDHILLHLDIDVLDAKLFHSTYFANKDLVGDGSGSGKMTMEKLSETLSLIMRNSNVIGFTIAEYLPFDEYELYKMFDKISLFHE